MGSTKETSKSTKSKYLIYLLIKFGIYNSIYRFTFGVYTIIAQYSYCTMQITITYTIVYIII